MNGVETKSLIQEILVKHHYLKPILAVVILAAGALVLAVRTGANVSAVSAERLTQPSPANKLAPAPGDDDLVARLAPKATLGVVQGQKTVAPAVPAPVTRKENKIVEYDLTVKETSALIAPNLTYQSLWTFA